MVDGGVAGRPGLVLRGHHDVSGAGRESAEALAWIEVGPWFRDEPLLGGLFGDAHARADVLPGGAGAAGWSTKWPIRWSATSPRCFGHQDRVGELVQGIGMSGCDGLDEIVEADPGVMGAGLVHSVTVG